MTDQLTIVDDLAQSQYVATLAGKEVAYIIYHRRTGIIDLQHTIVDPSMGGKGMGTAIVRFALDAARAAGDMVIPTCPMVAGFLERHPEYQDLVKQASS